MKTWIDAELRQEEITVTIKGSVSIFLQKIMFPQYNSHWGGFNRVSQHMFALKILTKMVLMKVTTRFQ